MPTIIEQAYEIAARDLRSCYNPEGIVAGRGHFNSFWSRDGFWGSFGALELGDFNQVKAHLRLFSRHQKSSGQFPNQIRLTGSGWFRFRSLKTTPKTIFRAVTFFSAPLDPEALFIIAVWQYFRHTSDYDFLREMAPHAAKAVSWLKSRDIDADGLIESGWFSDWMDSVMKKGKLSNVNMIWAKAVYNFSQICRYLKMNEKAQELEGYFKTVLRAINETFWNGSYFVDWVDGLRFGGFSSDANIAAVLFGFADTAQFSLIYDFIERHKLDLHTPLKTVFPPYPNSRIFPFYKLAGIGGYHSRYIWLWLGSLWALGLWRNRYQDQAKEKLRAIARIIVDNGFVGEVYTLQGKPVNRFFYSSEVPFAWNAAAFIYAAQSMNLTGRRHHVRHE